MSVVDTLDPLLLSRVVAATASVLEPHHIDRQREQQAHTIDLLKSLLPLLPSPALYEWTLWFESLCLSRLSGTSFCAISGYDRLVESTDDPSKLLAAIEDIMQKCMLEFGLYSSLAKVIPNKSDLLTAKLRAAYLAQIRHVSTRRFQEDSARHFARLIADIMHRPSDHATKEGNDENDNLKQNTTMNTTTMSSQLHDSENTLRSICDMFRLSGFAPVVKEIYNDILNQKIEQHVVFLARGDEYVPIASQLREWLDGHILRWAHILEGHELNDDAESREKMLEFYAFQTLCVTRVHDAFEIVRDFPESIPAISDLKIALKKYNNMGCLLSTLETAIKSRLLHCGAFTEDILCYYISTAKVMWMLECSEDAMTAMLDPIRCYLRLREDSLRQIVVQLIDHEKEPDDTVGMSTLVLQELSLVKINQLIQVFSNKETYTKDYQEFLAARLLAMCDFDVDEDKENLAMIELRLGNEHTSSAQVMMKDVQESRRFAAQFQKESKELPIFSVLIVSGLFWPSEKILDIPLNVPTVIASFMSEYEKAYTSLKAQTLKWRPALGIVDIEVGSGEHSIRVLASPAQASIISLFSDLDRISVDEAEQNTKLSRVFVKQAVAFWSQHRVLALQGDTIVNVFGISDDTSQNMHENTSGVDADAAAQEDTEVDPQASRLEKLQDSLWPFVEAALVAHESMSLHDVHQQLSRFFGPIDEADLRVLFDWAIETSKVERIGQNYISKNG
ncbi:hypothetical protein BASA60_006360 [Batrachochytrium salamandrivorans]|nr:hypothetical protein BASA60_006360 [Batrachochytrium salamandrivorans]